MNDPTAPSAPAVRPASTPNRAQRRAAARRTAAALGSAALLTTVAGAGSVLVGGDPAGASTYTVSTCADSGAGSLRQAILDAEGNAGPDVITITANCSAVSPVEVGSVMTITSGDDITITGPGAADFVLDGGDATRILVVANGSGDVTISGVTLTHGRVTGSGGAVNVTSAGDLVLTGTVFAENETDFFGGALYIQSVASLTVTDSVFDGNVAGAGGGALYLTSVGPVTISSSTFAANEAHAGGGGALTLYGVSEFSMFDSTVTGNTASGRGGGVFIVGVYGDVEFVFDTITDNVSTARGGGGIDAWGLPYDMTLVGNVVAGNSLYQIALGTGWTVVSHDNDLDGIVVGMTRDATDLEVDPQLLPLADNGGPTPTRALAATSPLIDRGPTSWPTFPGDQYDQRGAPYARVAGGRSDIGAFERQPDPPPPGPEPTPEPDVEPTFTG